MELITVIIPVYNVEAYLCECVDSILEQTYSNLEVLLIDDGSTDKSGAMCDEYKSKDSRIKVFHKSNGGLSDARNYGIDRMNGKYVTFVDSDDFLSKYSLEILYNVATANRSDLIFTKNAVRFNDRESVRLAQSADYLNSVERYTQDEILEYSFYQKTNVTGAPGKLYASTLFENGIRFPYGVYFEDLATTYKFILQANNIVMVDAPLYAYRMRNDGIIHQKFSPKKLTCIEVTKKLYKDICNKKPNLKIAAASRCCSCNRMVYSQIPYNQKERRNSVWNEIVKYRKIVLFDPKARKRERISCLISYLGQLTFFTFNMFSIYFKYKIMNR